MADMTADTMAVIEMRGISRSYQLGGKQGGGILVHALRNLDFSAGAGEFVSIMGPSGSGKSTLMNILGCLDKPSGGSYVLDGVETTGAGSDAFALIRNQKIGFVFQSFNLLARTTALENVELPLFYQRPVKDAQPVRDARPVKDAQPVNDARPIRDARPLNGKRRASGGAGKRRERAAACLREMGLEDRMGHLPSQLSGGQQQRVAIARAMVNDPAFILADEPTGNLDSEMTLEIMGLFQSLNRRGKTIVMVTHEPELAAYTKRVITLRDGALVSDLPVAESRDAAEDLNRLRAARKEAP